QPRHRLDYLLALHRLDGEAISREAISNARDDVRVAQAAIEAARAHAAQLAVDLDRLQVRAPSAGRALQVNVRPGEFATEGAGVRPPVLLGDDERMFVRVDIDENDAWRVRPGAEGRAFVRGDPRLSIPLRYEYVEPYVVPKTSLTGQATERTDVRVLQVVYSFARDGLPVYLGQQMDVFVRAAPAAPHGGRR
ncbi:MAG TPA: HlyD family efflux transporter periplasmic adaptor subunit, partial [Xanthomonadaceae bacterium]|nr:HlyD family efflux transporter periplasmic adaptor subunit [Xanthomonadaceae bacterium]